jgi:subtilisin family serine protease
MRGPRLKRFACAAAVAGLAVALWSQQVTGVAAPPKITGHHAILGPLAESALAASVHGHRLPTAWLQGRTTMQGTTYGVFLRGSTTAEAIARTGAVPGTVLSVGATADATLGQLALLAELPGITEVELAGQATRQLDVSVPAIHASEPGHASTAGVPHLWSGNGGSDGPYVSTQGGKLVWQDGGGGGRCCGGDVRVPVLARGSVYIRQTQTGNETVVASNGQQVGTFTSTVAPAFDSNEMFTVSGGVLTATGSNNWTYSGDGTPNSAPITAPIVVTGTVYVGAGSGKVYALPEAGNGLAVNTPSWIGNAGAPILAPVDDIQGQEDVAPPVLTGGLAVGGGMLIVPATGTITAFGDTTVAASPDVVTSYQIDPAHDGDQSSDSLTAPLAAAPKWSVTLGASVSNPMIANGMVYVMVDAAVVPPQIDGATTLYALNERTGTIAWQVALRESDDSGLGYDNGRIFTETAPYGGNELNAYDASTGALDWTLAPSPYLRQAAPVAMNGIAYVESGDGEVTATLTGYNELTGAVVQSSTFSTSDITAPAVSNTGVYSGGDDLFVDHAASIVSAAAPPTFSGDTGQGTVVGVVDTGIDLANADFQTNSGTRIVDLWDQAACPNPSSNACPTQPPNTQGFNYGAECGSAAINAASCGPFSYGDVNGGDTCNSPVGLPGATVVSLAEMDCDGHGTHVTGIAAGNGRAAPFGTYIGVAPQADLVIVKSDFDLAHIVDGVAYIFKVAAARGEPASVNISLGTNEGPHDGSDMFETMLDALTGPGKLVSVAGGNESTGSPYYHYHASGTVADGQVRTDGLVVQSTPVFLDLWYPGADSISAAVAEAGTGNGQTPWVSPDTTGVSGEDGTCTQPTPGTDEFQDPHVNTIEILSCTHMPNNGMNEIQIALFNPDNGGENLDSPVDGHGCSDTDDCFDEFKLLLRGNSTPTGPYNTWTFDQGDYFFYNGDGNDNSTLNEPASAHDVISVGSYVSRNFWPSEAGTETEQVATGAISDFSGHGPTLDGRGGIDIVAPGEEIGSSLSSAATSITTDCPAGTTQGCTAPGGNYFFLQGTSMASPHVAGALALLLEQQPTIDVAQAKSLLTQSANTAPLTSGGAATTWGAGKLEVGPGVLAITPASGSLAGGGTMHITGVDLQPGVTMSLGGHALALNNIGTNSWSATVPASTSAGAVALTISNLDHSTAVDPSAYVYLDPTGYHSLTPFRTCDSRSSTTTPANQCKGKTLRAGGTVNVQITGGPVPAGTRAVVVNVTAVNHTNGGTYVSAFPAGVARPLASNINLGTSGVATNLAIVRLSAGGAITLFNAAGSVDVIVDVEGYFATPTGSGIVPGEFHSIPPLRMCDTRVPSGCNSSGSGRVSGGSWRDVVLSGLPPGAPLGTPSIPADGTAATAVFNLTATGGTESTYLSVAPPNGSDQCPAHPLASNVNPVAGASLPIRVMSALGPRDDVCVFNSVGTIDFIIDVDGWFGTGAETTPGALFNSVAPTRICDTRSGSPTECAGKTLGGNSALAVPFAGVREVPMMSGTPPLAVVTNLTAVAGNATTFFTLYPSDVAPRPHASDLNPVVGEVIANLSIVGVAQTGSFGGDVSLYNAAGTINAILDVAGWFQ